MHKDFFTGIIERLEEWIMCKGKIWLLFGRPKAKASFWL